MDEPQTPPQQETAEKKALPPFVQIVKTPGDCQVNHNLIDPWLALALLWLAQGGRWCYWERGSSPMPMTPKGQKIMKAMRKQYGIGKGTQVFWASVNKKKLKGVEGRQKKTGTRMESHQGGM